MLRLAQQKLQIKQTPSIKRAYNILQPHLNVSSFLFIPFQMQITSQLTVTKKY